jgi:hypothetical protein
MAFELEIRQRELCYETPTSPALQDGMEVENEDGSGSDGVLGFVSNKASKITSFFKRARDDGWR